MGAPSWQQRILALMDEHFACFEQKRMVGEYLRRHKNDTFEAAWNRCRSSERMNWLVDVLGIEEPPHAWDEEHCWCYSPPAIRKHFPAAVVLARLEGEERDHG